MHRSSLPEPTENTAADAAIAAEAIGSEAMLARQGDALALALALANSRRDTLALFEACEHALPDLRVPQRAELNLPLWELGHIGWFQEFWLARFSAWPEGPAADPDGPRSRSLRSGADALYHSSQVAHASRWALELPDAQQTRQDLAAILAQTQDMLAQVAAQAHDQGPKRDDWLYFFRLTLMHEDMHHEAALYMAQGLGIAVADARWQPRPLPTPPAPLRWATGTWWLGADSSSAAATPPTRAAISAPVRGFNFDNELGSQQVEIVETCIDAQVLRWADYLPFAEDGAYADARCWTESGWSWRKDVGLVAPRYLQRRDGAWQVQRFGRWQWLDLNLPAVHLSAHEAQAYCRWARRRLPTEAEWERAAVQGAGGVGAAVVGPQAFRWGDVWEWTASAFAPFPGFTPHPYRDYSAPWFDGRPVLRGASYLTQPRMRHPRYRNFFTAERTDVPAGFRTCAL